MNTLNESAADAVLVSAKASFYKHSERLQDLLGEFGYPGATVARLDEAWLAALGMQQQAINILNYLIDSGGDDTDLWKRRVLTAGSRATALQAARDALKIVLLPPSAR